MLSHRYKSARTGKADAGRAVSSVIKQVTELVEAAAEGSKLTKADSGFN
ncbi:MAG: hypothetical protein IT237_00915 [Bacteroidia bacterium]|nr:hypothetical protein [Bacteroidia bacterium]